MKKGQSVGRWFAFAYSLIMLFCLAALSIAFEHGTFKNIIPSSVPNAALASIWAGALGGIAISLKGVFDHKVAPDPQNPSQLYEWNNQLLPWHMGRPFTGVIVGFFVFIALRTVYPSAGDPSAATLATLSFVLGTQDRAFFNFVRQIGEVIVSIPNQSKTPVATPANVNTIEKGIEQGLSEITRSPLSDNTKA